MDNIKQEKKEILLNHDAKIDTAQKKKKEKIFLEWSNINYSIVTKTNKKKVQSEIDQEISGEDNPNTSDPSNTKIILSNIEGFAVPNELLAIMGPSGCGKTTLLNMIAHRQLPLESNHYITREVRANNIIMDASNFGKICAYVMQEDILMDCLTPRESLIFGAKLKLKATNEQISRKVNNLLRKFGLEKCADSYIGNETQKGISGGERKRTSIAYEIISNPQIVIIDEPTTGMDSFTSLLIVKYLKQLANTGKTVSKILVFIYKSKLVCTIHQPSSELFQFIDRLILLKDGYLVYQGKAKYSAKYFEAINMPLPTFCNPFDFFLEILSDPTKPARKLNESYSKLCEEEVIDERIKLHEAYKSKEIFDKDNLRQVNWCMEYCLLLQRTFINYVRNKTLFIFKILNILFLALIYGAFCYGIGTDSKKNNLFQNYTAYFFNNVSCAFQNGIYSAIFMLPILKTVLKREYTAKLYRLSSFYLSLLTSVLINSVLYAVIFTTILFLTTQFFFEDPLDSLKHYALLFLMNIVNFTMGQYFGICIGGSVSEYASFIVTPMFFTAFMLGCGVFRGISTIPSYISWLFYISPYKYFMELETKLFSDYNQITKIIPAKLDFNYGIDVCIYALSTFTLVTLLLGFIGLKFYSAKF